MKQKTDRKYERKLSYGENQTWCQGQNPTNRNTREGKQRTQRRININRTIIPREMSNSLSKTLFTRKQDTVNKCKEKQQTAQNQVDL